MKGLGNGSEQGFGLAGLAGCVTIDKQKSFTMAGPGTISFDGQMRPNSPKRIENGKTQYIYRKRTTNLEGVSLIYHEVAFRIARQRPRAGRQ